MIAVPTRTSLPSVVTPVTFKSLATLIFPPGLTRNLSVPAVSIENSSALGNLIAVLVSPVCTILSETERSPVTPKV